jgi:hypothetical protein
MWSMPKSLPTPVEAFGHNTTHPTHLAFIEMGHEPCRPITTLARGNKFVVVAIEYFTRWTKAKPLATITLESVKKFFWHNIICRFRVPRTLIVDNLKQFDSDKFKEFSRSIGICRCLPPIACHGGTRDSCSGFGVSWTQRLMQEIVNLYWFGPSWSSNSLYIQLALAFALDWLLWSCCYRRCP